MRWIYVMVCGLLILQVVSAQELNITIEPEDILIGGQVNITCYYTGENMTDNLSAWAEILPPPIYANLSSCFTETDNYSFSCTYSDFPKVGVYIIRCSNGTAFSSNMSVRVSNLTLEMTDYPVYVYSDEEAKEIKAKLLKISDTEDVVNSGSVNFSVFLDGSMLDLDGITYFDYVENRWVIRVAGFSGFDARSYTLKLQALYEGNSIFDEKDISILPAYEFYIESVSQKQVKKGQTVDVKIHAIYHNSSILDKGNISVRVGGETVDFQRTSSGVRFESPDMAPGSYELEVSLNYGNIVLSDSSSIDYLIPVHGEILDANGKGIPGSLKFIREDWSKTIGFSGGAYSGDIPKGTYTVEASLPGVKATFTSVPVTEELENMVKFDSFEKEVSGFNVAKLFAIEFAPGFEKAYFDVAYDAKKIKGDENEIEVYRCYAWNMDARSCSGEWSRTEADVDVKANRVNFRVNSLSAFLIGERKELRLEAKLDRDRCFLNETVKMSGYVKDERGAFVQDAVVRYVIGDSSGETVTNKNGVFSIEFEAPEQDGTYIILVNASKSFYRPASVSRELTVSKKLGMVMVLPLRASLRRGLETSLELSLINSGQGTLTNITVDISGIPEEWFDYEPKNIMDIMPGEERKITLRVKPGFPDKPVYSVTVNVKSNELSESDSFAMVVDAAEENQTQDKSVISATESSRTPLITDFVSSYIVSNSPALINIGSGVASVLIALFLIFRLKAKARTEGERENIINILSGIKQEVVREVGNRKAKKKRKRKK